MSEQEDRSKTRMKYGHKDVSRKRTKLEQLAEQLQNHFAVISGGYSLASIMDLTPGSGFLFDWLKLIRAGELTVTDAAHEIKQKAISYNILGGKQ